MADYSTADMMNPQGYDPAGWYPGKKRKNPLLSGAAQALSLGIYNPDSRTASRANKMIAEGRIQTGQRLAEQKGLEDIKMSSEEGRFKAAQDRLRAALINMGKTPEEADMLVATTYGQPALEGVAKSRAATEAAKRDELKAVGGQVGAAEAGMRDTAATAAQSKLAAEAGLTGADEAAQERAAGVPAAKAQAAAAKASNAKRLAEFESANMREAGAIAEGTAENRGIAARNAAQAGAISSGTGVRTATTADRLAGAQTRLLDDPRKLDALAAAELDKGVSTTVQPNTMIERPVGGPLEGLQQQITEVQTGVNDVGEPIMKPVVTFGKPGAAAQPVGGAPSPVSPGAAVVPRKMKKVGNEWVPVTQ